MNAPAEAPAPARRALWLDPEDVALVAQAAASVAACVLDFIGSEDERSDAHLRSIADEAGEVLAGLLGWIAAPTPEERALAAALAAWLDSHTLAGQAQAAAAGRC